MKIKMTEQAETNLQVSKRRTLLQEKVPKIEEMAREIAQMIEITEIMVTEIIIMVTEIIAMVTETKLTLETSTRIPIEIDMVTMISGRDNIAMEMRTDLEGRVHLAAIMKIAGKVHLKSGATTGDMMIWTGGKSIDFWTLF